MKTTIELVVKLEYDTDTQEVKIISSKPVKASEPTITVESTDPTVFLSKTALTLNTAAQKLMHVAAGDYISLVYATVDGFNIPCLQVAAGEPIGNKLTKKGTIPCKGADNGILAAYGESFRVVPDAASSKLFYLTSEPSVTADAAEEINIDEEFNFSPAIADKSADLDSNYEESFFELPQL